MSNPYYAIIILMVLVLGCFLLLVAGLCVLAMFMPVVLVITGLYIMVRGMFIPLPWRYIVGLGLVLMGAVWLGFTW
jgi:hypothetical protein